MAEIHQNIGFKGILPDLTILRTLSPDYSVLDKGAIEPATFSLRYGYETFSSDFSVYTIFTDTTTQASVADIVTVNKEGFLIAASLGSTGSGTFRAIIETDGNTLIDTGDFSGTCKLLWGGLDASNNLTPHALGMVIRFDGQLKFRKKDTFMSCIFN